LILALFRLRPLSLLWDGDYRRCPATADLCSGLAIVKAGKLAGLLYLETRLSLALCLHSGSTGQCAGAAGGAGRYASLENGLRSLYTDELQQENSEAQVALKRPFGEVRPRKSI